MAVMSRSAVIHSLRALWFLAAVLVVRGGCGGLAGVVLRLRRERSVERLPKGAVAFMGPLHVVEERGLPAGAVFAGFSPVQPELVQAAFGKGAGDALLFQQGVGAVVGVPFRRERKFGFVR